MPRGFDFTSRMRVLCVDVTTRHPCFTHIDMSRVAVSFSQTRKRGPFGLHATLTPMRFENGALTGKRRGRKYTVQRLFDPAGTEMLYILSFYLPRFMDEQFHEKLVTVFHELWHISADFDGDLRRHPGRCYVHSHSQKEYDAQMAVFVDEWLALDPQPEVYGFLQYSFDELYRQHGRVFGVRISQPKLIPAAR